MPRLARLVVPGYPHHVVQRGMRSFDIFHRGPDGDADRETYLGSMLVLVAGTGSWPKGRARRNG